MVCSFNCVTLGRVEQQTCWH